MRRTLKRDFYRPSAALNAEKEVLPEVPGSEVYRYENSRGEPIAMVFGGKRSKPDFWLRFPTFERREERITEWVEAEKAKAEATKARRKARSGGHSLRKGDVLHAAWGYDQTNASFYEVVEVPSKCFVKVREVESKLASSEGASTYVLPVKGAFKGPERRLKAGPNNSVRVYSFASAHKTDWDTPKYETHWAYGH